jgi:hypothetical protein
MPVPMRQRILPRSLAARPWQAQHGQCRAAGPRLQLARGLRRRALATGTRAQLRAAGRFKAHAATQLAPPCAAPLWVQRGNVAPF